MAKSSCRKYHLLFLPLVVAFLMSFKSTGIQEGLPFTSTRQIPAEVTTGPASSEFKNHGTIDLAIPGDVIQNTLHKSFIKYRKKYKRISSASAGVRPPVRQIEANYLDLNGITTYVKPFFLSHLHSFLFRLTPF